MARSIGATLPAAVVSMLDGANPRDQLGHVLLLLTVDAEGFPHVCPLSPGEVVAVSDSELRVAVDERSRSRQNAERAGVATLAVIEPEVCCYAKSRVERIDGTVGPGPVHPFTSACIRLRLADVLLDDERGTQITTGARYARNLELERELDEWRRFHEVLTG
jgi:hypothetical protein